MYGYIYKTTCVTNNKIYVGKKKSNVFLGDKYLGSGVALQGAIEKYGSDKFIVEQLDCAESLEELNVKEQHWIKFLQSQNTDIGYNISPGGDGGEVWGKPENHPSHHTSRSGDKNPFYGKHHSEETLSKVKSLWDDKIKSGYTSPVKGKMRIHKDDVIKYINPQELDKYEQSGWVRMPQRIKTGERPGLDGKKWIVNDLNQRKRVDIKDIDSYLKDGWEIGMTKKK